jgi:hypothetical protein
LTLLFASYKPGDSAATIATIRTRLFITKDIPTDSKVLFMTMNLPMEYCTLEKEAAIS